MPPTTSRQLDLVREVGDACACHVSGASTDAATTSLTVADAGFLTSRTNASNRKYEGDELYLSDAQASSTLTAALTAAATSFSVADGSGFAASTARSYLVGIDGEYILVTRSTNTFTVVSGGRGRLGTRPIAHANAATVRGPVRTPNPTDIATYVALTGVLTPGQAWTADPGTVVPFDIFTRGVSYWDLVQAINQALRNGFYEDYFPYTLVTDGDMRADGTGDWTASGSPTVSKVANANAIRGPQSLRVLATVANDYVQSATIVVDPTYASSWYVRALLRADVGTATLRAWDATNSAQIEAETWSLRGWGILDFTFTLPATCEGVAFQLESDTSTSDVYWASLHAYPLSGNELLLPAWLERPGQFKGLVLDQAERNRYDTPRWGLVPGQLIPDPANPNNRFRFQMRDVVRGPLFLHASRAPDMLSGDAQTTYAERDLIVASAAVELCRMQASKPLSENTVYWRQILRDKLVQEDVLTRQLLPVPTVEAAYSRAW